LTPRLLSGTFRDFQRLKLKYEKLLSNFACFGLNCNLRPYTADKMKKEGQRAAQNPQMMKAFKLEMAWGGTPLH